MYKKRRKEEITKRIDTAGDMTTCRLLLSLRNSRVDPSATKDNTIMT